jgi:hypothetical protein
MIIRLLETTVIFYVSLSYIWMAYALWQSRSTQKFNIPMAIILFLLFSPLVFASAMWEYFTKPNAN